MVRSELIVPGTNTVVVGDESELFANGLEASRINWLHEQPTEPFRCTAKIRYRHAGVSATVLPNEAGAEVRFEEPVAAVTPGQAVAFYEGTRVLGGGWIERAL